MDQRQTVNNLIIADQSPDSWIEAVLETDPSSAHWHVLPLGFSAERYRHEYAHVLDRFPRWDLADVAAAAGETRSTLRDRVPVLLAEIRKCPVEGTRTIPDLLQGDGFNAWWFLEISEKSAYRGPFINRLYCLAMIQTVVNQGAYKEVWLCLKDRLLAEAIIDEFKRQKIRFIHVGAKPVGRIRNLLSGFARYAKHAVGIAVLHCAQVLMLRSLRIIEAVHLAPTDLLLFSFYPRMWAAPYSEHAAEWFFGSLPEFFPKEHRVRYAIWLTARPWEIWKRRRELRSFVRKRSVVCLAPIAGLGSVLALFSYRWWWVQIRLALNWQQRLGVSFLGFDISAIVADELRRSLSSSELFRDLILHRAWTNLARSTSLAAVLYRLEFQPFENAIIYGTKGRARTVAFQHSLIGENYLPYFFVPGELKPNSDPWAQPLPDLILTSGVFGREVMLRNGCLPETVEVCGPVRYRKLMAQHSMRSGRISESRSRLGLAVETKVLVVTTAVSREEAMGLLVALHKCIVDLEPFLVVFKSHPALPLEREFVELVGTQLGPSRYRILKSVDELYHSLTVAQAAILNHSTVAFEALVLGVLPIIFDSGAVFDPKAMEPHEWGGLLARNSEELMAALRKTARTNGEVQPLKERLLSQAGRWFDRPECDPYQRFIDILRKHGVLDRAASIPRSAICD